MNNYDAVLGDLMAAQANGQSVDGGLDALEELREEVERLRMAKRETQQALEECRSRLCQCEADLLAPADWRSKIPVQLAEWQQMSADLIAEKAKREKAERERDEWCCRDARRINDNGAIAAAEHERAEKAEAALVEAVNLLAIRVHIMQRAAAFVAAHSKGKG